MINKQLLEQLEGIRFGFIESLMGLDASTSFKKLLENTAELRKEMDELAQVANSPRVSGEFAPEFTVAFVGGSSCGKSTILGELFPDLAQTWLLTNATDTTSQALQIRENRHGNSRVCIHSWNMDQIKRLFRVAQAANEKQDIKIGYQNELIEVDGSNAIFGTHTADSEFKFGRRIVIRPFPSPYALTSEEAGNPALRQTISTKEEATRVPTGKVLCIDGKDFNALELRTVIKSIDLGSNYERIRSLMQVGNAEQSQIVFVDTPGLSTHGSTKDEMLRNTLARKNEQIIVEMLRDDELDLIVHLVLVTKQSPFQELRASVRNQCKDDELADIDYRLILGINGMNIQLTNADLVRAQSAEAAKLEGDHLATTLNDNILRRMSDHGVFRPARICFMDSQRQVEALFGDYAAFYAKHRATMESWTKPNGVGYETLKDAGIVDSFKKNIDALCNPQDRGQGFLLRQINEVIQENCNKLLLRKYLNKSRLHRSVCELRRVLGNYYDSNGLLNTRLAQQAVKACTLFLNPAVPSAIERFAGKTLDPHINDKCVPIPLDENATKEWPRQAFKKLASFIFTACVKLSESKTPNHTISPQTIEIFKQYIQKVLSPIDKVYRNADLQMPTTEEPRAGYLVRHALKFHAREVLHQLVSPSPDKEATAAIFQDEQDRNHIKKLLSTLDDIQKRGEALCNRNGVPVP